ncbi:nudC domain-containing protein 1 [Notothenia coriiceps]|uniref:NudC domain-containing protein 1 n=1 Tax=Notothenia coriiceps TaxID=8208 RepID=A0A6I9NFH9_9TELE|nr:PREDICTED: nudC domain-containing protein 1 [Notothenia coriiceps]
MAASNYSLKVNRELLDPNFESYRLSLDSIPTYNVELDAAVEEVKLKDTQYTLEHMRAFGMYNYLHLDPWYEDSVLFVDCKGRVLSLTVTLNSFSNLGNETLICCVLVLSWQPLFLEDTGEPFSLLHSISHVQEGVHSMEVLLLRIQKEPQETKGSGFCVSLEWITVANSAGQGQEKKYEVKKRRVLNGKTVPHYAAVEPKGKGLMVASEKPFAFTHVDGLPVQLPDPEPMEVEKTGGLELTLQKREEGPMWSELVMGDKRGEYVMSDEQAALIHERLTFLTSEDMNGNPDKDKPPCNSQELEDCDGFPEDGSSLTHFDGESLKPSQVYSAGYLMLSAYKRTFLSSRSIEQASSLP